MKARTKSYCFDQSIKALKNGETKNALTILESVSVSDGEPAAKALRDFLQSQIATRMGTTRPQERGTQASLAVLDFCKNSGIPLKMPSGRPWPKISVITPSYNQGQYIEETILSVINQKYPNVEYIIIDGGSTDNTAEVVSKHKEHVHYFVSEKDRGQSHALNKGFHRASGDILCWLNSDDQFAPNALYAVALAFDSGDCDLVSGICEIFKDGVLQNRHMTSCADGELPLENLLDLDCGWNAGQFFYQPEVFFSRDLWERSGGHVREDCFYSMDYELWCRFAYAKARLKVIGTALAWFRTHPEQKTAATERFKAELVLVRDRFVADRNIKIVPSTRPLPNWSAQARIALVNDHGPNYGAGIAHARIAASLEMAGHEVELFELRTFVNGGEFAGQDLLDELKEFAPDFIVFGNMHSVGQYGLDAIELVAKNFPSAWVTHDFWIFTGRCAYFSNCDKYVSGCDASCPSAHEYPSLAPELISAAWQRKKLLLATDHSPDIWGNSSWSTATAMNALMANAGGHRDVHKIRLGAPSHLYGNLSKEKARHALGLAADAFIVLFSASSLSDERKGGSLLVSALQNLNIPSLTLLAVGNIDQDFSIAGANLVCMGYVTDNATLVSAITAADVFVGPSTEETFGQVFVEAAMCGTPSIGFDQTGVADAIAQDVSGLRTVQTVSALKQAIHHLYANKEVSAELSFWAKLWARNTFSLEASYRTLYHALDARGLIDKLSLPHKIGFVRSSRFIEDSVGEVQSWRAGNGISPVEGPYPPDIPLPVRWCFGASSKLKVKLNSKRRHRVEISYYSPLFSEINVTVFAHKRQITALSLPFSPPPYAKTASFELQLDSGWHDIVLNFDKQQPANETESRALTILVQDVTVTELNH